MEIKKIKEFIKDSRLTREEVADYVNYSRMTVNKILTRKGELEGRMHLAFSLGIKKLIEAKIEFYQKALSEWEKISSR